jgi:sec-independent protein translocase protein TatC
MKWLFASLSKFFTLREQKETDMVKPFLEHLEDLRVTLFKMGGALIVGMVAAYCFHRPLVELMKAPLAGTKVELYSVGLLDGFSIALKLSFYLGVVISFPFLMYFLAEFVLPALTRKEKRLLLPGIFIAFLLFAFGVVACYKFILPKTVLWFFNFTTDSMGLKMLLTATTYFAFVAQMCIACGLLCELPIVMVALALMDLISFRLLAGTRPYAYIGILILVAILSPSPDPFTFATLAVPVVAVYELCIWLVWLIERRRSKSEKSGQQYPD